MSKCLSRFLRFGRSGRVIIVVFIPRIPSEANFSTQRFGLCCGSLARAAPGPGRRTYSQGSFGNVVEDPWDPLALSAIAFRASHCGSLGVLGSLRDDGGQRFQSGLVAFIAVPVLEGGTGLVEDLGNRQGISFDFRGTAFLRKPSDNLRTLWFAAFSEGIHFIEGYFGRVLNSPPPRSR